MLKQTDWTLKLSRVYASIRPAVALQMDLGALPEKDRKKVVELLEKKQSQQFMTLYNYVVNNCFTDCIKDFTSTSISDKEENCVKKCTEKLLKHANRIGTRMAEKQSQLQPSS